MPSNRVIPRRIQVYENHAGPIPAPEDEALSYEFVAYADAENDAGLYGYGHTVHAAIADYCRNCAECYCGDCTDCENERDCLLTSGELSTLTKHRIREYENNLYFEFEDFYRHSTSHIDWIALNGQPQPYSTS
jgi:hypothetical protein